jgi:hypothetical protein
VKTPLATLPSSAKSFRLLLSIAFSALQKAAKACALRTATWHSTCITYPRPWFLKNTDISTTKAAVELALTCGWRRLLFAVFRGDSMNRIRTGLLGLGLLLAVSAAQAQKLPVKANIPFDFVVGDRVMPAGEYQVSDMGGGSGSVAILSEDRKANVLMVTSACTAAAPSKSTKLVFHAIGGRYFLSQVWSEGYEQGRQLWESKAEILLAKNRTPSKDLVLAAHSR